VFGGRYICGAECCGCGWLRGAVNLDQRERIADLTEALDTAIEGELSHVWTALPGIVTAFRPAQMVVDVQPAVQAQLSAADGTVSWVSLPVLRDVPVVFPCAGGFAFTLPIGVGDEVLVVFSARCIDSWFQNSGVGVQAELRMHNLSDGFAIPGPRSLPRALPAISTTTAQLRTVDGTSYIELAPGGVINIKAPGGVHVTGAISATGDVSSGTVTLDTHVHTGVTTGGGSTGLPVG
jgi:Phage protein Gp138 N-terminal domain/GpV Apex motif